VRAAPCAVAVPGGLATDGQPDGAGVEQDVDMVDGAMTPDRLDWPSLPRKLDVIREVPAELRTLGAVEAHAGAE
jgi:hypothetical protein